MKKTIGNIVLKAKAFAKGVYEHFSKGMHWKKAGHFLGKYGYYCGLMALLMALGAASMAYQRENAHVNESIVETPVEVSAVVTPAPSEAPVVMKDQPETTYIWPVAGEIIGEYAPETLVWNASLGQYQTHPAIDIAGSAGQSVVACADGVVKDAYTDELWGHVIVIGHGDGSESTYANLNTLNLVAVGQKVSKGQTISAIGKSAGAELEMIWHLHFEMKDPNGRWVDFSEWADD